MARLRIRTSVAPLTGQHLSKLVKIRFCLRRFDGILVLLQRAHVKT